MSNANNDDLSALSHNAEQELKHKPSSTPRHKPSGSIQSPGHWGGRALLATTLVAVVYTFWHLLAPPASSQVAGDLSKAMDMASTALEEARKRDGQLPEALPNAALAALIGYEKNGTEYRLTGSVGGVLLTLEWDGTRQVSKVSP